MNIIIFVIPLTIVFFTCQCFCYKVRLTAFLPRGFRACIAHGKGMESFAFYAYILDRKSPSQEASKRLEGTVTKPSDGLWCYEDEHIVLHFNDVIVYWYRVEQNGTQTQSDSEKKKFQAVDFVDQSGHSVSTSTIPSYTIKPTTETISIFQKFKNYWFKPKDKHQKPEDDLKKKQTDFDSTLAASSGRGIQHNDDSLLIKIETSTTANQASVSGVYIPQTESDHDTMSTADLANQLEVQFETKENTDIEDIKPKSNQTHAVNEYITKSGSRVNENTDTEDMKYKSPHTHTVNEYITKSGSRVNENTDTEDIKHKSSHTHIVNEYITKSGSEVNKNNGVNGNKNNATRENKDPVQNIFPSENIQKNNSNNMEYESLHHIDISKNRKEKPSDIEVSNEKTGEDVDAPSHNCDSISLSQNIPNKSCEVLLSMEKESRESTIDSYRKCIAEANSAENDLIVTRKESKRLHALFHESRKIVNYLKGDTTNKLVLQSFIPLINNEQTLHEIINTLLEIKSDEYTIVEVKDNGSHMLTFELGTIFEKLNILLSGRIRLTDTSFQIYDYDK